MSRKWGRRPLPSPTTALCTAVCSSTTVSYTHLVELEPWDRTKNYDRTGLETDSYDILGVKVPSMLIPVMPGQMCIRDSPYDSPGVWGDPSRIESILKDAQTNEETV